MRRTSVARSPSEIQTLRSRWEHLQANCTATIFQSFKWNSIAADLFSDRVKPHVIFVESDSGMALLPLGVNTSRNTLECLGDALFDYRDVLSIGDRETLAAGWSEAAKLGIPFSSGGMLPEARELWAGFHRNPFYRAPQVKLNEINGEGFAERHTRSASRLRRLQRMGLTLREHRRPEKALVRWIYKKKAAQPPEAGENAFTDPRRVEFMSAVFADSGCEEVFTLESEQACVAALVTFREAQCRRFYTIWFDQNWSKHSPGVSLICEVTRRSLTEGLSCDYMTGEQAYKMRFATSVDPLYWTEASAHELKVIGEQRPAVAA